MIEVIFYEKAGELVGFKVSGHAGYAESGEDIVCSAVSSAVIMTANTVTEIAKASAEVFDKDGEVVLRIPDSSDSVCTVLLQGLRLHLLELQKQYSDFINIKFTEV